MYYSVFFFFHGFHPRRGVASKGQLPLRTFLRDRTARTQVDECGIGTTVGAGTYLFRMPSLKSTMLGNWLPEEERK